MPSSRPPKASSRPLKASNRFPLGLFGRGGLLGLRGERTLFEVGARSGRIHIGQQMARLAGLSLLYACIA